MNPLHLFMTGASSMGCLVAAVVFLRYWRDTRDRLFSLFAVAFVGLALNRALLAFFGRENQPYLYLVRLAAFVLIAIAIVDKNRR